VASIIKPGDMSYVGGLSVRQSSKPWLHRAELIARNGW